AMGEEVLASLSPTQQVVAIVRDELTRILGSHQSKLRFANVPPSAIMIVGLQGSGKTTSTGKLARWLSKNGHNPIMVSVDVYRPAARQQLAVIARDVKLPIYAGTSEETKPLELARSARREARGGAALSIRSITGQPLKFVGVGEKFDALEPFHPDRVAQRILGMGDMLSLIEKVEENIDQRKAEEMQRKLIDNEFTLEDFRDQIKQIRKLGPLESIIGMMPQLG